MVKEVYMDKNYYIQLITPYNEYVFQNMENLDILENLFWEVLLPFNIYENYVLSYDNLPYKLKNNKYNLFFNISKKNILKKFNFFKIYKFINIKKNKFF
jgi:hypothetical protein